MLTAHNVTSLCSHSPHSPNLQMKGCEAYTALCAAGSTVPACTAPGPLPGLVTTYDAKAAIDVSRRNCPERS